MQNAHEREVATCHETVRILKQRLNEREEQFATQKRRKLPVDYYALKAKVCCSCSSKRRDFKSHDDDDHFRYRLQSTKDVFKDSMPSNTKCHSKTNNYTFIHNQSTELVAPPLTENWPKFNNIDLKFMFVVIIMLYNFRFICSILMSRNAFYFMVTTMISILFLKLLSILRFM